jgi:hypothetical protein
VGVRAPAVATGTFEQDFVLAEVIRQAINRKLPHADTVHKHSNDLLSGKDQFLGIA